MPRVSLAQPSDAHELAQLYSRCWGAQEELVGVQMRADLSPGPEEIGSWMGGGFELYRASLEGRLVGAVRCCFPVSTCYLDRLAVEPEQLGRGFGRYLVEHVLSRARRAGVTRVWSCASPRLGSAVGLLRDLDFRITARQQDPRWDEEMLLLELSL